MNEKIVGLMKKILNLGDANILHDAYENYKLQNYGEALNLLDVLCHKYSNKNFAYYEVLNNLRQNAMNEVNSLFDEIKLMKN
jgi:hypothetical protein